ncbi:LysR substrate-binding domain-containing protein [Micromonospora sp. KC213]|uniref:LysR substrate-binding domain-containing protein n=1 Tax=Micromonospora sp. KC213 TaxID=2530378 RepID=UPI00104395CE|nr:LysR substrate-binding domain-containing protein [Micromonospora sp. KC213]TDC40963.1 LysR family transcriptional regulator [Micromonospora sp. KC213]
MELTLLQTFREVVRRGSITAAASALGYTQSAVSRQMGLLEHEFAAPLLHRHARGVELTEEGQRLLEHAEAILDRMDRTRRELAAVRAAETGQLSIGAFATAGAALVPRALSAFRSTHPAVSVTLVEGPTPRLLTRLAAAEADLVIVSTPARHPPDPGKLCWHHLMTDRLLVAMAGTHHLAGRRALSLADLADEPWIAGPSATDATRALAPAGGFAPRIAFTASDWTTKFGFVASGLAVTAVPAIAASAAPPDVTLVPVTDAWAAARDIFAVTAGRHHAARDHFLPVLARTAAALAHGLTPAPEPG